LVATGHDDPAAMTEPDTDAQQPTPTDDDLPFGDFEVETEPLPDGRRIHYYRWPADESGPADV